jgi:hypothetical protein
MTPTLWLLEDEKRAEAPTTRTHIKDEPSDRVERQLVCAACGQAVTHPRLRIEVNGAHEHTFINPEGVIYRIGAFSAASGAVDVGPPSTYFSWFAGHAWRVAICKRCTVHLGWSFRAEGSRFVGLILERLREADG